MRQFKLLAVWLLLAGTSARLGAQQGVPPALPAEGGELMSAPAAAAPPALPPEIRWNLVSHTPTATNAAPPAPMPAPAIAPPSLPEGPSLDLPNNQPPPAAPTIVQASNPPPFVPANLPPAPLAEPQQSAEPGPSGIITASAFVKAPPPLSVPQGPDTPLPLASPPTLETVPPSAGPAPAINTSLVISANGQAAPALVSVPSGIQNAILSLEKVGPTSIKQGQPLTYEIVVRNASTVAVANVHVEDELAAGVRFVHADPAPEGENKRELTWSLGRLDAGAERRLKVVLQPADEGEIVAAATATFSVSTSLRTRVNQPRLVVKEVSPETVQVGEPAVFQIQVANAGSGPATHVVVHNRLPPGLKHPQGNDIEADLGTMEPGQTRTISLETRAVQAGRQVDEVTALADDGVRATGQAAVRVVEPGLALHRTGPQRRYLNREAEFDLEVSNPGSAPATGVQVVDTLPAGLEFASASDGGIYNPSARTVTWTVGMLPPGLTHSLVLRAVAKAPGDLVNRVEAAADRGLQAREEAALHVEGVPALMMEVADLEDPIEVGAETTYEIRVGNQGTAPSTGLQIIATIPDEMAPRGATGPTPFRMQGQQVIFEPVAKLAEKAGVVFRVRVVGKKAGDVRFKVQMTCDQQQLPVYVEESTRVYSD